MQYIFFLLTIPFLYINYKIVKSDLKDKIIPNKYLLYLIALIPFYYIYIYLNFSEINYLLFLLQIVISIFISFLLFSFNIWSAWDAKYLLILSLFIPQIGIIPFIWNLAIITIWYLLLYFLRFYFGKCIFIKWYANTLKNQIKNDLWDRWENYKNNKWWKSFHIIFKWILVFLIIFVSIRLSRIYLFNSFFENWNKVGIFQYILEKYHFYLIFLTIWIFLWIIYLIKSLIEKLKYNLYKKYKIRNTKVWYYLLVLLFIFLISFIIYEFIINPIELSKNLINIFTIYLLIYIIIKILLYSYKIAFHTSEYYFIDINELREWDIVDKTELNKLFHRHWSLKYFYEKNFKLKSKYKKILLNENIEKIIINPIDKKTRNYIIKLYKVRNFIVWKIKKDKKNKIKLIKIMKTYPFWMYIFIWFIITFLTNELLLVSIINIIFNIIKDIYL